MRKWIALVLMALVLLVPAGGAVALDNPAKGPAISLTGTVEFVSDFGPTHYEVNGYVLISDDPTRLSALKGEDVVVTGIESEAPSIFMRKLLHVNTIALKTGAPSGIGQIQTPGIHIPIPSEAPPTIPHDDDQTIILPVVPEPAPVQPPSTERQITLPVISAPALPVLTASGSSQVTIPVVPDPSASAPPGDDRISIPAPPSPFFGTAFYVLFGRVEESGGLYFISENRATGEHRSLVTSEVVPLQDLIGKQVAAIAAQESTAGGISRYRLEAAVVLTDDLAGAIQSGLGMVYVAPKGEVSVKLRGRLVHMDQAPIMGNSRTLVGLRAIGEALGARVEWEGGSQTATVTLADRQVIVRVGRNLVIVRQLGGTERVIYHDVAPVIVNGRIMVPARVLSEGLGLTVDWNADTRTVILE